MPPHEPVLQLLGLAARAGAVVAGTERVREALRAGKLKFAILAGDASSNALGKVVPLLVHGGIPHQQAFDRALLGGAVGQASASAVGLTDPRFAERLAELMEVAEPAAVPETPHDARR